MNMRIDTSPQIQQEAGDTPWARPEPVAEFVAKHSAEEVNEWRGLRDRVVELAQRQGWNKAEVSRRAGMKDSTFSQWLSGKLLGVLSNQNRPIALWLDAVEESAGLASAVASSPRFIQTRAAKEIFETLLLAQITAGFVTVTLDAGRGKTTACRFFRDTRPHVYLVTLNPKVKSVSGALNLLALQLGVRVFNPAELVEAIGGRLARGGDQALLIVDEAQHADAETVNQLRYFSDNFRVGLALVGNSEIRKRLAGSGVTAASRDQVVSRIDKNLKRDPGREEDVRTFIQAWGITEPACVKFLFSIGMKGGALRQIDRTIKIASLLNRGSDAPLDLASLQAAWRNRDVEDLG